MGGPFLDDIGLGLDAVHDGLVFPGLLFHVNARAKVDEETGRKRPDNSMRSADTALQHAGCFAHSLTLEVVPGGGSNSSRLTASAITVNSSASSVGIACNCQIFRKSISLPTFLTICANFCESEGSQSLALYPLYQSCCRIRRSSSLNRMPFATARLNQISLKAAPPALPPHSFAMRFTKPGDLGVPAKAFWAPRLTVRGNLVEREDEFRQVCLREHLVARVLQQEAPLPRCSCQ